LQFVSNENVEDISKETADALEVVSGVQTGLEVTAGVLATIDLALLTGGGSLVVEGEGALALGAGELATGATVGLSEGSIAAGTTATELAGLGEAGTSELLFVAEENLLSFEEAVEGISEAETLGTLAPAEGTVSELASVGSRIGSGLSRVKQVTNIADRINDVQESGALISGALGFMKAIFGKGTSEHKDVEKVEKHIDEHVDDVRKAPEELSAEQHGHHKSIISAFGV